jgi:peptide/nickel transport system ATP-binding protein/peptide/nickel transport system permease protein
MRSWRSTARNLRLVIPLVLLAAILACAAFAHFLAPYDPIKFDVTHRLADPGEGGHILGTDEFGRDVLSRLIYGARASMEVSLGSAVLACLIGVTIGLAGGYFAGLVEIFTVRLADLILSFPPIVLAILVVTLFGPGIVTLTLVIALLYVPSFARITYGQVLTAKRMEYVEATRALGGGHLRLMFDTILPNVLAPIIVQFSLAVAAAILLESGLSFLGLGVVPPTPSWGLMIRDARGHMLESPNNLIWPCLVIVVVILAINMLGDALRDRLDPRLRGVAEVRGDEAPEQARGGEALQATGPSA